MIWICRDEVKVEVEARARMGQGNGEVWIGYMG